MRLIPRSVYSRAGLRPIGSSSRLTSAGDASWRPGTYISAALLAILISPPPAPAQTAPLREAFALNVAAVVKVMAAGNRVATVATTSIDQMVVTVHDTTTGQELFRKSIPKTGLVGFGGKYLARASREEIVAIDVDRRTERGVLDFTSAGPARALCLAGSVLHVILDGPNARMGVRVDLENRAAMTSVALPSESTDGAQLLCSTRALLLWGDRVKGATIWREGAGTGSVELDGRTPLALTDDFLFATKGGSTIARLPLAGGSWEELYSDPKTRVAGASATDGNSPVSFLQRAGNGPARILSLPTAAGGIVQRSISGSRSWSDSDLWSLTADRLITIGRRDGRVWAFVDRFSDQPMLDAGVEHPDVVGGDPGQRALLWLQRQLGPVFVARDGGAARLIDSYEDDDHKGWTYDAALAAITLTAWGKTELAKQLLTGLGHLQREDGSWEFAYDMDRAEAIRGPRYTGAMAWVVMAANFFQWETHDETFDEMAERGLRFIEHYVITDPASPFIGGVTMGPGNPQTISTENSVDAFSAFLWRGRLSDRATEVGVAERLRKFLWERLAAASADAPFYFKVGATDGALYLDAQTWTTLALSEPGGDADTRFTSALEVADARLRVENGHLGATDAVAGFRDSESASPGKVWTEGTEGMVAARLARGEFDRARAYHSQIARLQTQSGGIPYATDNADAWSTRPSVAGTAWFLLNQLWPPRNPFAPDSAPWIKQFGDQVVPIP
jgi:hypothetical protein